MQKNKKYKIITSIVFGFLGFIANFYSLKIMNISKVNFNVNLLWGLIFPLLISLAWGYKYGLLSALTGGTQTIWFLWPELGYGLFYYIPILTMWMVWHGLGRYLRKSKQKWYLNKYIFEIPFRIISIIGFYSIFRYLISLNPPFWASDLNNNLVSLTWINNLNINLLFSSYILLLTTDTLLHISKIRNFFDLKHEKISQKSSLLLYSFLLLGFSFWIIDTIMDYFFYYDQGFLDLLLFNVPAHEIYIRIIVLLLCLFAGLITSSIYTKFITVEQKYKTLYENIEDAIFLINSKNKIIEVNEKARSLTNYKEKNISDLSLNKIINLSEKKLYSKLNEKSINKFETEIITKNKDKIPVEIKTKKFKMEKENLILAISRDISDRKEYEEKLKSQKEELQATNEQLSAFSEEIVAMNKELNQAVKERENLNDRFNKLIDLTSGLTKYQADQKIFLSNLLKTAVEILPEADYGSIYTYEGDYVNFVNTIGDYDLDTIENLNLPANLFYNKEKPIEIADFDKLKRKNQELLDKDTYNTFYDSLNSIKEIINCDLSINGEKKAGISIDIAAESNKSFTENSKRIFKAFHNLATSFFELQEYNKLQEQFTQEMVSSLINILEVYDKYTKGHSENVAEMAAQIAEKMNLSNQKIKEAYWAGMIHDIGKLLIPLKILNKEGSLTKEEYNLIKKHPVWTHKAFSESKELEQIAHYALYHHEKWNGNGYPEGLKHEEIPLVSRILGLVDAWDAMRSNRAYRNPLSENKAIKEIKKNKNTQFAPKVTETFLETINNSQDQIV